jgi:uncharacterized lipoprotein YddW (UPF0748 family)
MNSKGYRKLLTYESQITKLAVKELRNTKLYAIILISVMFVGIFILSPAISSLINDVTIRCTGRIATVPLSSRARSEIRGVFVHCMSLDGTADWDLIAQTCKDYKIDRIYSEMLSVRNTYYPSAYRPNAVGRDELGLAIAACHARGMEFHLSMDVVYVPKDDQPELRAVDYLGNPYSWSCASNPAYRTLVKNLVEELATNYDIDGFMFDYIRWDDTEDICYCPYCKEEFQAWLGETITDWTPFYPGGSRQNEFLEFRNVPITETVALIRDAMRAIKPNLEFSLAAWTYFEDCPMYWRKYLGQDTGDWIRNDYIDVVAPMMYTTSLSEIQDEVQTNFKYMTAGPEGKIPLLAFLDCTRKNTPQSLKAEIDWIRTAGVDGWILWRYGGPGDGQESGAPDIRNYLSIVDMPDTFTLGNIQISTTDAEATITWTTDLPATSTVEYSTSPLFTASWELWREEFNYWDIDHVAGTLIENSTLVTDHSIILTDLLPETKYYFRVQSQDPSGTATSEILTFTTS